MNGHVVIFLIYLPINSPNCETRFDIISVFYYQMLVPMAWVLATHLLALASEKREMDKWEKLLT